MSEKFDLGLIICPITKYDIYKECRLYIFSIMDNGIISPQRADEILGFVKDNVVYVDSSFQAKEFVFELSQKFCELKNIEKIFQTKEDEKVDNFLKVLIEEFMENGDIEYAGEIIEKSKTNGNISVLLEIKQIFNEIFEKCLAKFIKT